MRSVRYSEAIIRQVIREKCPRIGKGLFFFWDELAPERREKILKNEYIPSDIEPIAVYLAKSLVFGKHCFVIGPDNVLYGDRECRFPGGKLSFRDMVDFTRDHGEFVLRFADGSQMTQPDSDWGKTWLQDFFSELVDYDSAIPALDDPRVYDFNDYRRELQFNSVRRSPDFILADEMNYLEREGVAQLLPDLPAHEMRGFLPLNHGYGRHAYLAVTENQYRLRLDGQEDCVDLNQWDYFLASPGVAQLQFGRFRETKDTGLTANVAVSHLRQTEELLDYQMATLHYNLYFDRMKTEPITREKANLLRRSQEMMRDYWDNKAEYPWAENPRVLKIKIAFSNMTKDFDEIIFYYRLLHWAEAEHDVMMSAYAGFIAEFLQPLTVTGIKRMFYYVTIMESGYVKERDFYQDDPRLKDYIREGFYGSSLIDRRNELAARVNAMTGDAIDMPQLPVRDGYVMDWYMAQKREWERNCE